MLKILTTREIVLFKAVRDTLAKLSTLIHFDLSRILYFDYDISGDSIGIKIYYIDNIALKAISTKGKIIRYPLRIVV